MRQLDNQINERKRNWLEHSQRKPSERILKQIYIINGQNEVIRKGQAEDSFMFEKGTGKEAQTLQIMTMIQACQLKVPVCLFSSCHEYYVGLYMTYVFLQSRPALFLAQALGQLRTVAFIIEVLNSNPHPQSVYTDLLSSSFPFQSLLTNSSIVKQTIMACVTTQNHRVLYAM